MKVRAMKQALFAAFQGRVEAIGRKEAEAARLEHRARALRDDARKSREALERSFGISLNGSTPAVPTAERAPRRRARRARPRQTPAAPVPEGTGSKGFGAHILHALHQMGRPATKREIAAFLRQAQVSIGGKGLGAVNIVVSRLVRANKLREKDGGYTPA